MTEYSVSSHLRIQASTYDAEIRRFVPGYEEMLATAALRIAETKPDHVLDLGAGTGALSEAILSSGNSFIVELIDRDPVMLDQARARLSKYGSRARFREASFLSDLPECDVVAASLSLHHIPRLGDKHALYKEIHRVLADGGIVVNADVTMPADTEKQSRMYRLWADFMIGQGIEEERAFRYFDEWSGEDTYYPIEDELDTMRSAGFLASCIWRNDPMAILVGRKAGGCTGG